MANISMDSATATPIAAEVINIDTNLDSNTSDAAANESTCNEEDHDRPIKKQKTHHLSAPNITSPPDSLINSSSVTIIAPKEPLFRFQPYVPILRPSDSQQIIIDAEGIVNYYWKTNPSALSSRLIGEILPDDTIVEAPSLVTPLLLKKKTTWPPREADKTQEQTENVSESGVSPDKERTASQGSDDVQIVKIVNKHESAPIEDARYKPVGDYVKSTVVASLTNAKFNVNKPILAIKDYYRSSVGELLLGIGFSRVKEFTIEDSVKRLTSKIRKGNTQLIPELESLRTELVHVKKSNSPYNFENTLECPHCQFKTDSSIVLEAHLEVPHKDQRRDYVCNWCRYRTKDVSQITLHNYVTHKKRCRIEKPLALHCCRYCPFECKSKRKFTSHIVKCEQSFQKDIVQGPQEYGECDYPAITSKFISQEDVKAYESTLKALRLAAYNPHQIKVSGSQNHGQSGQPILMLSKPSLSTAVNKTNIMRPSMPISAAANPYGSPVAFLARGSCQTNINSDRSLQASSHLLQLLAAQTTASNNLQQRASILKHPKAQSSFVNGMSVMKTAQNIMMAPQAPSINGTNTLTFSESSADLNSAPSGTDSANGTFLICEICDGYIENFSQFKSHMQWVHKVKIHQKMLEGSRPPLNCQKCQWRFYTDQGLERHLLGAHGLVTPNMREQADNETDSGRCTICGCKFAKKLVAHMKDFHKANLKPAQLSYRCTVCSATFSLYRLFENHVYKLHSQGSIRGSPSE